MSEKELKLTVSDLKSKLEAFVTRYGSNYPASVEHQIKIYEYILSRKRKK